MYCTYNHTLTSTSTEYDVKVQFRQHPFLVSVEFVTFMGGLQKPNCARRNYLILWEATIMQDTCGSRLRLKCEGTRTETRFRLSAKGTSPFKSAGVSVQSTTGSRGVHISGSNAGYTMFRGSVKGTGYPLHSPVSPSLPLLCAAVCHHVSTGIYTQQSPPNNIQVASNTIVCLGII